MLKEDKCDYQKEASMWKTRCWLTMLAVSGLCWLMGPSLPTAIAGDPGITFELTDEPGAWFKNAAGPIAGTHSLVLTTPGTEVEFIGRSNTGHTRTSLMFPTGAINMPFDTEPSKGSDTVMLRTPGLYVFTCKTHPYMFGAVIVDDPSTEGLDLGETITLVNGTTVPTRSDLATRLLRLFFIATNPSNWQNYTSAAAWHITYPSLPVRITRATVVDLADVLSKSYGNDIKLEDVKNPVTAAVGEIWVDTQFEKTSGKTKPGTATAISGQTWKPIRKVALSQVNTMNNPHNMWTNKNQNQIYQTRWFDNAIMGEIAGTADVLPIQTPVSPDGKSMITVNTLTGTIAVIDPKTDKVVKLLGCDPGCHGVQYGAKQGGGYYAYVSSKFSNRLIVVDPDPNGTGNTAEASIAGSILLTADANTDSDATVIGNSGMGGQGILPIPVVYNGWGQNLPQVWKDQLPPKQ